MQAYLTKCAALAAVFWLGPASGAVEAQSIISTGESFVSARLLLGEPEGQGTRNAGLHLKLRPEWKTYWRAPGEAGIPPDMDWSESENVASIEIDWPRPHLFQSFGLTTLGYEDQVVLPLRVTAEDPTRPVSVRGDLTLGVCREICVFEQTEVSLAYAPGDKATDYGAIETARAQVPPSGAEAGVTAAQCRIDGAGEDRDFSARLAFSHALDDAMVILEGPADVWFHQTKSKVHGYSIDVRSAVTLFGENTWLDRSAIRITVLAGDYTADIRGCTALQG